jgi:hypothetical protein
MVKPAMIAAGEFDAIRVLALEARRLVEESR